MVSAACRNRRGHLHGDYSTTTVCILQRCIWDTFTKWIHLLLLNSIELYYHDAIRNGKWIVSWNRESLCLKKGPNNIPCGTIKPWQTCSRCVFQRRRYLATLILSNDIHTNTLVKVMPGSNGYWCNQKRWTLVLQMHNSLDISAPGHSPWILDWTCFLWTPLCHVYIP